MKFLLIYSIGGYNNMKNINSILESLNSVKEGKMKEKFAEMLSKLEDADKGKTVSGGGFTFTKIDKNKWEDKKSKEILSDEDVLYKIGDSKNFTIEEAKETNLHGTAWTNDEDDMIITKNRDGSYTGEGDKFSFSRPNAEETLKYLKKLGYRYIGQENIREATEIDPKKLRSFMLNQLAGMYGEEVTKKTDDELKSLLISHFGKNAVKDAEKMIKKHSK